MNRLRHILQEQKYNKKKALLESKDFSNTSIVCVDIQPEYGKGFTFKLTDWLLWVSKQVENNKVFLLYNGADTVGELDESGYKYWLYEQCEENGIETEWIDECYFYDKGYAFFRYCIDKNVDEEEIVHLIKFMVTNNINDSRDINSDMWVEYKKQYPDDTYITDLMEVADDMINIPDLMDYLKNINNIVLTGGGINECLKEVELALQVLDKPYQTYHEFTY